MVASGRVRRLTITGGQVAAKFGISEPTFKKRLPLLLEEGFPKKLPGSNHWSEPAVDRWFASYGSAPAIEPVAVAELDEARRELEDAYAPARVA